MKRKGNLTVQKGVTVYLTEYQIKQKEKERAAKSSSSTKNVIPQGPTWCCVIPYGGQAGSMGPNFTDVDWSLSTF